MSKNESPNHSSDQSAGGSNDSDATLEIAANASRISVKAPPFWRANPALWFCQLEAQFDLSKITSDKAKYNTVVAAIESSILHQVSDLVLNPPPTGLYVALKKRLLDVFVESEHSRLKKLLGEIELNGQKPSTLLREMRGLAGESITEDLLKTLFLQRLPHNIQAILAISSEGTDSLAIMADKIYEASGRSGEIGSMTNSNDIQTQISQLSQQMSEMQAIFSRHENHNNERNRSRSRSRSTFTKNHRNRDSSLEAKVCWYHTKFGDKASFCVGNCNYKTKQKLKSNQEN